MTTIIIIPLYNTFIPFLPLSPCFTYLTKIPILAELKTMAFYIFSPGAKYFWRTFQIGINNLTLNSNHNPQIIKPQNALLFNYVSSVILLFQKYAISSFLKPHFPQILAKMEDIRGKLLYFSNKLSASSLKPFFSIIFIDHLSLWRLGIKAKNVMPLGNPHCVGETENK